VATVRQDRKNNRVRVNDAAFAEGRYATRGERTTHPLDAPNCDLTMSV
jgi:hypothetical protein